MARASGIIATVIAVFALTGCASATQQSVGSAPTPSVPRTGTPSLVARLDPATPDPALDSGAAACTARLPPTGQPLVVRDRPAAGQPWYLSVEQRYWRWNYFAHACQDPIGMYIGGARPGECVQIAGLGDNPDAQFGAPPDRPLRNVIAQTGPC